jgi:hypothetical protein
VVDVLQRGAEILKVRDGYIALEHAHDRACILGAVQELLLHSERGQEKNVSQADLLRDRGTIDEHGFQSIP